MKKVMVFSLVFLSQILFLFSLCLAEELWEKPKIGETDNTSSNPRILFDKESLNAAIGLRSTYFGLTNSRRLLVGNLNALEEEQNLAPYKPMVQINLSKYLALEFGYDQFKAMALNQPDYDKKTSDGNLEWETYMYGLQFRLPLFHPAVIPYILGGVTYNKASFKENNWWRYGFPSQASYNDWVGQGNRMQDYTDYRRIIKAEDSWGAQLGLGVDYFLWKHLALNLDFRYHIVQSNLTFQLADSRGVFSEQHGTFNMSSWILGLGLKYFFF
ncbi:MAG: hypothetical protein C0407_05885 [Desulfobacca sp.]|nr:hypothetical protein [Desulfobacca sp.]